MRFTKNALIMFTAVLIVAASIQADVPNLVNIQGVLNDADGSPVADGDYAVTFRIYDGETGGNVVWSETVTNLAVENGIFNALLGRVNPLPAEVFSASERWMSIQVENDEEMSPRSRIASVAYSLRAAKADTADVALSGSGWSQNDSAVFLEEGNVGIGVSNPRHRLVIDSTVELQEWGAVLDRDWDGQPSISFDDTTELRIHACGEPKTSLRIDGDVTIDEGSSLDVTGPATVGGFTFRFNGADFVMKHEPRGSGGRALVHDVGNKLVINYAGDFTGGAEVWGSGLTVLGRTKTGVLEITGGADLAEPFPVTDVDQIEPGMAVVIDAQHPGHVKASSKPYDRCIAGVVSGAGGVNAGIRLVQSGVMDTGENIALTGRVFAKATNVNGTIQPGDLLTTSSTPGHLMKATDSGLAQNATVGKAMSPVDEATGLVLVLINLQ